MSVKNSFVLISVALLCLGIFIIPTQIVNGDETVNVNALVPEWPSSGTLPVPDSVFPIISDIKISEINTNSVNISWKTNEIAVPQINYGETSDYTKTFIGDSFTTSNSIFLENLSAGAIYHFEIIAVDRAGNRTSSGDQTFETLFLFDIISPANVNLFTAKAVENKIILNWENPQDSDFLGIQINKNINFPALDINHGEVIYSGNQESFEDKNIENGVKYYYTAFSYDNAGNFSSGAIVFATGIKTATPSIEPPIIPDLPVIPSEIIPFDVENLETVPDLENKEIEIKWNIPEVEEFEEIEIYRSADFPTLIHGEGEFIYKGKENNFTDGNIESDIIYYYTVFIKDKSGKYSSGKSITGMLRKLSISPIKDIDIKDINFIFSKEALLLPQRDDGKIYTFPNKEINIYYDSKNLPETLKTIVATVGRSSYILNSDSDNKFYKTKFISPEASGYYPITISVLDFKHGKIFQTKAELIVEDCGKITERLSDLDLVILKIKNYFGISVKEKYSLENAKIALFKFNKEGNWTICDGEKYNQKNPQFTDKNGNFGFMVPNGKYKITVEKEGYYNYSKIIEVENNIINSEIEMVRKAGWMWIGLVIMILFLGFIIRRKVKKIQ